MLSESFASRAWLWVSKDLAFGGRLLRFLGDNFGTCARDFLSDFHGMRLASLDSLPSPRQSTRSKGSGRVKLPRPMAKESVFRTQLFSSEWLSASPSVPRSEQKLTIVLHGRGDSIESYRDIRREMGLRHMNYLVLNAPKRYHNGYSWGAIRPQRQVLLPIRARLFGLIEELRTQGWAASDIYLLGHSQGALVASDLVLHHREQFAGVIVVSGYVWLPRGWRERIKASKARLTPWLITHGSRDRIIFPREIRQDVTQLLKGEIALDYREFAKGHDFDFDEEVPFIRQWIRSLPSPAIQQ